MIILFGVVLITSYKVEKAASNEVLTVLGIADKDLIFNDLFCVTDPNCIISSPVLSNLATLKALSTGDKLGLANEAFAYAKAYCNSQEFKTRYEEKRMSMKPEVPLLTNEEKEMVLAAIAEQEELFTPEILDMLPPEGKENALQPIEDMKAQANGELTEDQKKKWEAEAPADPNTAIKRTLQEFLNATENVDFNAPTELDPRNKHQVFVNPTYEEKDLQWKACYRAGKELTDATRNFAKEWLAELN